MSDTTQEYHASPDIHPGAPENIHRWEGISDIHSGIAFSPDRDSRGIDILATHLSQLLQKEKEIYEKKYRFPMTRYNNTNETGLISDLLCNVTTDKFAEEVVSKFITTYPNISWLRGGEVFIQNNIGLLDQARYGNGADGYVGDINALLRFGYRDNDNNARKDPALYVIPLSKIVDAAKQNIIGIGTHHSYDIRLFVKNPNEYPKWCSKHVQIYRLGDEKFNKQNTKGLLLEKCIVT